MRSLILLLALFLASVPAQAVTPPTVRIANDAFAPATLTVTVGTTVLFVNSDDDAHTVTSTDGFFDSKGLDTNHSWSYTFRKPGTYTYFCELHPFMKGAIVVKAAHS